MDIKSIKIDEISLVNFMSFKQYKIDNLSNYKIIFINGSNAQGKSTLVTESIYFSFFGKPLRYEKIIELLNWECDKKEISAFSEIKLSVEDLDNNKSFLSIKRNIVDSNDRYEFSASNNENGIYNNLYIAKNIPAFNTALKELLDVTEQDFSILYLKSPFSQVIFDSSSELLSNITKSEYINELRKDFINIASSIKIDLNNVTSSIEKQNQLISSIANQLKSIIDDDQYNDNKNKLNSIIEEIEKIEKDYIKLTDFIDNKKNEYKVYQTKKRDLDKWISKAEVYLNQIDGEISKINNLIIAGKCYTCEQLITGDLYEDTLVSKNAEIDKYKKLLNSAILKLREIENKLEEIEDVLNVNQSKKEKINDNIRSLTNIKATLSQTILNHDKNQKVNDDILTNIRKTILTLNEELNTLTMDYKVVTSISKLLLAKNSEYINEFYNNKIHNFNIIFKSILSKITNNKFYDVKMLLNNKPILNENIQYKALSTSERKSVDISFILAYIVYLSVKLKFKTFILDEFFDNYDNSNISHIYNMIYEIAEKYGLQLFITTNNSYYLLNGIEMKSDIKIINL